MHTLRPRLVSLTGKIQWQTERGVCVMQHYWASCQIVCLLFLFRFLPEEIVENCYLFPTRRLIGFMNAPRNTWGGIRSALCKVIDLRIDPQIADSHGFLLCWNVATRQEQERLLSKNTQKLLNTTTKILWNYTIVIKKDIIGEFIWL